MDTLAEVWRLVASLGGGLALLFIVTLAAGIVTLTVVYVGSAVVVLERFARVARRPWKAVLAGLLVACLASAAWLAETSPELAEAAWSEWRARFWGALAGFVAATGIALTLVALGLRRIAPARLANGVLIYLALCLAALTGGSGFAAAPLLPAGALGAIAAVLAELRRRRGGPAASISERRVRWMLVAVLLGLPLAALSATGPGDMVYGAGTYAAAGFGMLVCLGLLPMAIGGFLDMRSSVEWFIAVRYLVAKRRQVFISAITGICVLGIAAGVWLIVVVLSVMNGFEQTWRDEILGDRAHFVVKSGEGAFADWPGRLEEVRSVSGVVAATPYLDADGMVRGAGGSIYSVRVRGIDPGSIGDVTSLREDMISGSVDALQAEPIDGAEDDEPADPGILIGSQLSGALGAGVGDDLLVISPFGGPPTPLGPAPRLERFRVAGVYRSSFYQYDEVYTYVNLAAAQAFRRSGPVIDGIEGLTTDYYRSRRVGDAVTAKLGEPFETLDWKDFFPAFFQALKTERVMMFLLLTMIMVVAAFVIVATLIMMIMEKSSDIAILKAMGAQDGLIERIFALEGTLIGLVGTLLGVLAGLAVTHRLTWIHAPGRQRGGDRHDPVAGRNAIAQSSGRQARSCGGFAP
jgi:lipoprotein-releasing system permease protein